MDLGHKPIGVYACHMHMQLACYIGLKYYMMITSYRHRVGKTVEGVACISTTLISHGINIT